MKRTILLPLLMWAMIIPAFAADLVVQQSGPIGTYGSISAAVTAASDGDRILIVPRPGGVPWQEDVTLNKSLELIPGVDGTRYLVEGNYTVSPFSAGKTIKIVGMENILGNISTNNNAPGGPRTKVSVVGCDLQGNIGFDYNNFDITVAHNIIVGNVYIRFGRVIGNDMLGFEIEIDSDVLASNDVVDIIGNRAGRLEWYSTAQFFNISNNYFINTSSSYRHSLLIDEVKNSGAVVNSIVNNSINISAGGGNVKYVLYLLSLSAPLAKIDIINNAIDEVSSSSTYGIYASSVTAAVYAGYNHIDPSYSAEIFGVTNDGTNRTTVSFSISGTGVVTGAATTNGGHPANQYYDIDLSRNDVGCYGGSFTQNNYYPITAGPHVYMVRWPRGVYQGSTLSIEADGYDR